LKESASLVDGITAEARRGKYAKKPRKADATAAVAAAAA
jgi:hypothetical protein